MARYGRSSSGLISPPTVRWVGERSAGFGRQRLGLLAVVSARIVISHTAEIRTMRFGRSATNGGDPSYLVAGQGCCDR